MPSYKYKIYDLWYETYITSFAGNTWYSEIAACMAYDVLSEKHLGRYEIHKFKNVYPIVTFE